MGKNIAKDFNKMWEVAHKRAMDAVFSEASDDDMKDMVLIDGRVADKREQYLSMMLNMYKPDLSPVLPFPGAI